MSISVLSFILYVTQTVQSRWKKEEAARPTALVKSKLRFTICVSCSTSIH